MLGVVHVDTSCLCLEELEVVGTLVGAAGVVGERRVFVYWCVLTLHASFLYFIDKQTKIEYH